MVVLRLHRLARQGDELLDAEQRAQRRRHGEDGVPVHPRRDHPLEALRQDDAPQGLPPRIGQRFGGLPLAGRHRQHRAAHDLRDIRHDRQGQAEHRLHPVRNLDDRIAERDLEREGQHHDEQQHQPGRVAERLGQEPADAADRAAQGNLAEAEQDAEDGADRHGGDRDRHVEQEAAGDQEGQPADQRVEGVGEAEPALGRSGHRPDHDDGGEQRDGAERQPQPGARQPPAEQQVVRLARRPGPDRPQHGKAAGRRRIDARDRPPSRGPRRHPPPPPYPGITIRRSQRFMPKTRNPTSVM